MAGAARIDNFHQVNPVEYAEPSERTEIYLLYDDDALYVGVRMYTPPGEITANVMRQGASITQEDSLFVTLDPFNTQRGGYFFGLNAHGVRVRRSLSQRLRVLQRLGHHLGRRRAALRGWLDGRVRDPVQVAVVRSEQRHVGPELLA